MEEAVIMTRNNIPEVSEKTGFSEEKLIRILNYFEAKGIYPVMVPIIKGPEDLRG